MRSVVLLTSSAKKKRNSTKKLVLVFFGKGYAGGELYCRLLLFHDDVHIDSRIFVLKSGEMTTK